MPTLCPLLWRLGRIVLVITKILQIICLQSQVSKVFLDIRTIFSKVRTILDQLPTLCCPCCLCCFGTLTTSKDPKICIKYRKHWKSYVSFQPSGQIWADSPNWHQFFHVRLMTIYWLIFKKLPKSEKAGLPCFLTKKGMLVLVND